jgi:soluble lytic murein transglycosylase-like protein
MLLWLFGVSLLLIPSAGANLEVQPVAKSGPSDPWPQTPPKIGRLDLKPEYWGYMKEAARKYRISPYLIQAVCAIESRYDPYATSGRGQCIGLMQLHRDTAKKYGVNPLNPRENIMGGAAVLANLLTAYNGDLRRVLNVYNATCTAAYEREVFKAFNQAMLVGQASYQMAKRQN